MKKIFTLIAVAAMAISANAQSWNFSNWNAQTFTKGTEVTIEGLTVNPSGKDIVIDANNKTVDGVKYTQRLKFGGKGSPTEQNIYFTASGAGTLKVIVTSSSGSEDRQMGVALNGEQIATAAAKGGVVEAVTFNIASAGTVAVYGLGGVNLYLVEFTSGSTAINTVKAAEAAADGAAYNLAGQKVNAGYKGLVIKNGKKVIVK